MQNSIHKKLVVPVSIRHLMSLALLLLGHWGYSQTQASNIVVNSVSSTEIAVSWTPGDGPQDFVLMTSNTGAALPVMAGTEATYSANSIYGLGALVDGNWYVVYTGTASSVNVTGLEAGVEYQIYVNEYSNDFDYYTFYNTSSTNNPYNYTNSSGGVTESFEEISGSSYFYSFSTGGYSSAGTDAENTIVYSGAAALRFYFDDGNRGPGTLTLPVIDGQSNFDFYYAATGIGESHFVVEKSVNGAAYQTLASLTATSQEFVQYSTSLTDGAGAEVRVRITFDDAISDQELIIDDITFTTFSGEQTIVPLITKLTHTPGSTTLDAEVSVDVMSDIYYVITQSASPPSSAQIIAGQDESGATADNYNSYGSITGTVNFSIGTGTGNDAPLQVGSGYYIYWVAVDGSNSTLISNVESQFFQTTNPPSVTITTLEVPSIDLSEGTSDNLIYEVQLDVTNADASFEGFFLSLTDPGAFDQADFSQFNYYYSLEVDDIGNATYWGSDGFDPASIPMTDIIGYFDDQNAVTIPAGSSLYLYVTADMASTLTGGTFSLDAPGSDSNFAFTESLTPADGGLNGSLAFTITASATGPEIEVQGNSIEIVSGDNTPSTDDGTDFGQVYVNTVTTRDFVIKNTGTQDLTISGISASGDSAFEIVSPPSSNFAITAGSSYTFQVQFTAYQGTYQTEIQINNDDADEGDPSYYSFFVTAVGIQTLAITKPIVDDVYNIGNTVNILFEANGFYQNDSLFAEWSNDDTNWNLIDKNQLQFLSGQFDWILDESIASGSNYTVRIRDKYQTVEAISDPFSIVSASTIETFEDATAMTYTDGTYALPSGDWVFTNSPYVVAALAYSGTQSLGLTYSSNAAFVAPAADGGSDISFYYAANGTNSTFLVETSTDGVNFSTYGTYTATSTTHQQLVITPNAAGQPIYVKVTSGQSGSTNNLFVDDFTFTPYTAPAPEIIVTDPTIDTEARFYEYLPIKWTSQSTSGYVKISLSDDGGSTFPTVLAYPTTDNGEFSTYYLDATAPWTQTAVIRVEDASNPDLFDDSDPFILNPINIYLSNSTLSPGSSTNDVIMQFGTYDYGSVTIEYSTDGGNSWTLIDDLYSSCLDGSCPLTWDVPDVNSSNAVVRVSANNGGWVATSGLITINGTATAPTTQAGKLSFSNITETTVDIGWNDGDGEGRLVVVAEGSLATMPNVSDGSNPEASTIFKSGGEPDTGWFAVYNSSGSGPITVTGLSPEVTYTAAVLEYNGSGTAYNTSTAVNNPGTFTTSATAPVGNLEDFASGIPGDWIAVGTTWQDNPAYGYKGEAGSAQIAGGNSANYLQTPLISNASDFSFYYATIAGGYDGAAFEIYTSADGDTFTFLDDRLYTDEVFTQYTYTFPSNFTGYIKIQGLLSGDQDILIDNVDYTSSTGTNPVATFDGFTLTDASLDPGTSDNLIYQFSVTASGGEITPQGFYLTLSGAYSNSDFAGETPFGLQYLVDTDDFGSSAWFADAAFGDGITVPTNGFGFTYTDPIADGSTVYFYITADISPDALGEDYFNVDLLPLESFGIVDPKTKVDNGLAIGPNMTINVVDNSVTESFEELTTINYDGQVSLATGIWEFSGVYGNDGPNLTGVSSIGITSGTSGYVITPAIDGTSPFQFSFYSYGAEMTVSESVDGGVFTPIETFSTNSGVYENYIYTPTYTGSSVQIKVEMVGANSTNNLIMDDFVFTLAQDNTPPTIDNLSIIGTYYGSFDFEFLLSETSDFYYAIIGEGDDAPTAEEIMDTGLYSGTGTIYDYGYFIEVNTSTGSVYYLTANTKYDLYFVAKDLSGNTSQVQSLLSQSTKAPTGFTGTSENFDTGLSTRLGEGLEYIDLTSGTWTGTGVTSSVYYSDISGNGGTGDAALISNTTGNFLQTPLLSNAESFSVYVRPEFANAATSLLNVKTSLDGQNWSDLISISNTSTTFVQTSHTFTGLFSGYIRFEYAGEGENTVLDDFEVTYDEIVPIISGSASVNINENTTSVGAYTADETVTWALSGVDKAAFIIDVDGNVFFSTAPDFETPTDVGSDNTYDILIEATDVSGNIGTKTVAVTIADIDEVPPTITGETGFSIDENTTAVGAFTADEEVIWTISGDDQSAFSIDIDGNLTFSTAPDFESPTDVGSDNTYDIVIEATDLAGNVGNHAVSVAVLNIDEVAPVITGEASFNIVENTTAVGTYTANEMVTWEVTGTDESLFTIGTDGVLSFASAPDYESPTDLNTDNVYEIYVKATDAVGNKDSVDVLLTITDANDNAPQITDPGSVSVNENSAQGTVVVTFEANDVDTNNTFSWSINSGNTDVDGDTTPAFAIDKTTGTLSVNDPDDLDYESGTTSFSLQIVVGDGVNAAGSTYIISVNDVSEAITVTIDAIDLSNNPSPALSGTVGDPVATITINVNNSDYPGVNNGDGTWSLVQGSIADLSDGSYTVTVTADNNGVTGVATATINVDLTSPSVLVDELLTNSPSPGLTGFVDDLTAMIQVTVNGVDYTGVNNGDLSWSLATGTIEALTDGVYDVQVTATDLAGNAGTDATTDELTVNLTAPTVTVSTLSTLDDTPALSGTVSEEATVTVTVDGASYDAAVANGNWLLADNTVASLAVGTYDVVVTATDLAGNEGTDATTDELTIEAGAPTAVAATAVDYFSFTASWNLRKGVESYQLDVSRDGAFVNLLTGYANLSTTNNSVAVTSSEIQYGTEYYYRVRAVYPSGDVSTSSNVITVRTLLDPGTVADSLALLSIYDATGGDSWTTNNWKNGESLANWTGVTMTGTRVTGVDLSSNNLTGKMPSITSGLENLQTLNLSGNNLTDLGDLTALTSLTKLDVRNNQLQFATLETNINVTGISYSPQQTALESYSTLQQQGIDYTIDRTVSGSSNSYSWIKQNLKTQAETNLTNTGGTLTISINSFDDEGGYYAKVTNSNVPGLTLTTGMVTLKVSSLERDFTALQAVYDAMGGANWSGAASNWPNETDYANWTGVTIQNERVVSLSLPNVGMTGVMPDDILDVQDLQTLDVSDNRISGIPDFTVMTKLTSLNVSGNNLEFDDLLPNAQITGIDYSDQRQIGQDHYEELPKGSSVTLDIPVGGAGNQYTWTRSNDVAENTVVVDKGTAGSYTIEAIDYETMGDHVLTVTNPGVPNLTLTSRVQTVLATATLEFTALDLNNNPFTAGNGYAFKVTAPGTPYDTLQTTRGGIVKAGKFVFSDLILGDFLIAVGPDNLDEFLVTYYPSTDLWVEATEYQLREDATETLNMAQIPPPLPALPDGGVVQGTIYGLDDGNGRSQRVEGRKKVKRAACSMRRFVGSGRVAADSLFELYAYVESDDDGNFTFADIEAGLYRFNIEYPGIPMDPASYVEFEVGADGKEKNTFTLQATVNPDGIVVEKINELGFYRRYFKNLEVYPNPANFDLTVTYAKLMTEGVKLRLIDLNGMVVYEQEISKGYDQQMQLDVRDVPSGMYILTFIDPANTKAKIASVRVSIKH